MGHPVIGRYADRVIVVDECWEWIGAYSNGGKLPTVRRNYKTVPARRVIAQALGADLDGRRILVSCDNHWCVNPAHYRILPTVEAIRTVAVQSAEAKRRKPYKPNPGNVKRRKLTPEQVSYVRGCDASSRALAREFGVSHATITAIRRGEKYKEVGKVNMWSRLVRKLP